MLKIFTEVRHCQHNEIYELYAKNSKNDRWSYSIIFI